MASSPRNEEDDLFVRPSPRDEDDDPFVRPQEVSPDPSDAAQPRQTGNEDDAGQGEPRDSPVPTRMDKSASRSDEEDNNDFYARLDLDQVQDHDNVIEKATEADYRKKIMEAQKNLAGNVSQKGSASLPEFYSLPSRVEINTSTQEVPTSKTLPGLTGQSLSDVVDQPSPPAGPDKSPRQFHAVNKASMTKKQVGPAFIEAEIKLLQRENERIQQLRKEERDKAYEKYHTSISDGEDESPGPTKKTPPPTARKTRKRKAAPVFEDDDLDEAAAEEANKSGKRAKNGRARKRSKNLRDQEGTEQGFPDLRSTIPSDRTSGRSKAKAAKETSNSIHKNGKKATSKTAATNISNVQSIMGSNVFADTARNENLASQPRFEHQTRKYDALKDLVASVPSENRRIAQTDRKALDAATKEFTGQGAVSAAPDGTWSLRGMKTTLKHYQILGASFLRKRENDIHEPRGGILADEMGLGKTLMMLANIINGLPPRKQQPRTTLIVAQPAILMQWHDEVKRHCKSREEDKKHGYHRIVHHRGGRRLQGTPAEIMDEIRHADICFTTYTELCKSYPKAEPPLECTSVEEKQQWWQEHFAENKGIFHRIKFHRIVLDEAQAIKNHLSHTSNACRVLEANHYWAVTGTPVMNSVSELYPYFKFLRIPQTGSYQIFKHNHCSADDPDGIEKLAVLLRKYMIRRTHRDTLFGARLLSLPRTMEHTVYLRFTNVERQIYEIVKHRFVQRINKVTMEGNHLKSYTTVWTLLLRLRQICSHVLLIQDTLQNLMTREDYEKLNKITADESDISEGGAELLVHLRDLLRKANATHDESTQSGIAEHVVTEGDKVPTANMDPNLQEREAGGMHGTTFEFSKYWETIPGSDHWQEIMNRTVCAACRQPPVEAMVTSCHHVYCRSCVEALQHSAAKRGHENAKCSECGEVYQSATLCRPGPSDPRRASVDASQARGKKKPDKSWLSMGGEVLPSAKTKAAKAAILNWLEADPTTKIIVYTQFLDFVSVFQKVCRTEDWEYVTYHGGMSFASRAKAIEEFRTDAEKKIMIASLKCGGLGLNLTMASKVICIDPWWNTATEQQAFCRVFRIGQEKQTSMTRLVIRNTVDEAMMKIKEKKDVEIHELMTNPKMYEKLSVEDLMGVFGQVREENGRPFIVVDDPDVNQFTQSERVNRTDEDAHMGNEP